MPMLMQQVDRPQEEYLGGGSTPAPIPTPAPVPGYGLPSEPKRPTMADPSIQPVRDASPSPATPTAAPEPPRPAGAGTAPAAPSMPAPASTPSAPAYSGNSPIRLMDWRQGLAETDRAAVTRTVNDRELTSKQLSRLLDENGRYIASARLRARENAANSGMLMSTLAAGAAERAAIDAAMPIAQSDANAYMQTSSENMRALNEDVQADQGAGRNLFGQQVGLDAQAQENEIGRRFTSAENAADRTFRGDQAAQDRALTIDQNERQRQLQLLMQDRGISADMARQIVDQQFTSRENRLTREQNATLEMNRMANDRFGAYTNMLANRERDLQSTLSSIYSNPNLSAAQQAAAASNARAVFDSITTGTNAALSAGVPQIFARPFIMPDSRPAAPATLPSTPATTPVAAPASGVNSFPDTSGILGRISSQMVR